jgi:hypothetical protein
MWFYSGSIFRLLSSLSFSAYSAVLVGLNVCSTAGEFHLEHHSNTLLLADLSFRKWSRLKAIVACISVLIFFATLEVVLILVIRGPYSKGSSWPVELIGITACIMLIGGYLPICFEIIKRRGRVVGVSFLFLAIDCSGAIFSLLSLRKFFTSYGPLCAAA